MITLISPPWYFFRNARIFVSQNLGLGYLAAYLEMNGIRVKVIDALTEGLEYRNDLNVDGVKLQQIGLPYSEITGRITEETQYVGIGVPFTMYKKIAEELTECIKKEYPHIKVIMGGVYPSTLPHQAFNNYVDYLIVGEGEIPLLKLIKGKNPTDIKGLWFREKGKIVQNGVAERIVDLDSIPFPARHLFPFSKYIHLSQRGHHQKKVATMITSRGCPYDCSFCSVHHVAGYKWRYRSPRNVIEEIRELVEKYQVNHIEFEDDNLTLHKDRAAEFFDELIKFNKDRSCEKRITWSCDNGMRVDAIDYTLMKKMKESGCVMVALGVESGDQDLLNDRIRKNLDLKRVREVVMIGKKVGIRMSAFMIVGHPGETIERYENSIRFFLELKKLGVEQFAIHIINVYPGTRLAKECEKKGYLRNKDLISPRNMITGLKRLERVNVDVETEDFSAKEVVRRRNKAYRKLMPIEYYSERYPNLTKSLRQLIPTKIKSYLINRI